jgi:hypothetical protein
MKTLQFQVPDEIAQRLEDLVAARAENYASVNTEATGRDALLTDLLVLGLDELAAAEDEFPDDVGD